MLKVGQEIFHFFLNGDDTELVGEYKYLGVFLVVVGPFIQQKYLAKQAEKAMYSLIKRPRSLLLPLDLQIELFEKLESLFYYMVVKSRVSVS